MNAKGVTAVLIWILRFCIHVAASSVLNMTCRQMGDRTTYTILDRPTSVGCSYSYSNGTKHIIAHDTDYEPALVLNKSLDSLITSKCIREVIYEATCDKGHFYSANCTVACTEFRHNKETSDACPGIVVGVLVAVMIVVVVVVAVVVRKKLKHKYAQVRKSDEDLVYEP